MDNKNIRGHLSALFTVFVWGTTFISTKVLLEDFKAVEILFYRFMMGFIILNIIYVKRLHVKDIKRELLFGAAGICGVTLYYLFENIALTYTMSANVSVILSAAPFFTALFSRVIIKKGERQGASFFAGFVIAVVGICLISFKGNGVSFNIKGDVLALMAAVIWALYSVITMKISEWGYNIIQVTRRIFGWGLVFMVPFLFAMGFEADIARFGDAVNLGNILFLGICASALCFVTWNSAVRILGPVKTSAYIYLSPVVTIITAFAVLGERMSLCSAMGAVLVLGGLVLSQQNRRK